MILTIKYHHEKIYHNHISHMDIFSNGPTSNKNNSAIRKGFKSSYISLQSEKTAFIE